MPLNKKYLILLLLPLFVFLTPNTYSQSIDDIDEIVLTLKEKYNVPGLALAIVKGDSTEVLRGYGLAQIKDSIPVNPNSTVFRIASVSKLFIATASANLIANNVLDKNRDIQEYIPEINLKTNFNTPITLYHLLTHTAGFDERMIGYAAISRDQIRPLGEYLADNLPYISFQPGEYTAYSNHGMALAAYIVEKQMGMPFHQYARDSLFHKIGMSNTSYMKISDRLLESKAIAYRVSGDNYIRLDEMFSHPYPVGLAYSTAEDMAKFITLIINNGKMNNEWLIDSTAIDQLIKSQFSNDPNLVGMSYGFFNQSERGWSTLTHAGSASGYKSLLAIVPEAELGFFFVTNGGSSRFGSALKDTLLAYLLENRTNEAKKTIELSYDHVKQFEGPYQLTRTAHHTVEKLPALFLLSIKVQATDRSTLLFPVEGWTEFQPIDSFKFREIDGERELMFKTDDNGNIVSMFGPSSFYGADFPGAYTKLHWFDERYIKNEYMSFLIGIPLVILFAIWPLTSLVAYIRNRKRGLQKFISYQHILAFVVSALFYGLFAWFGFGFIAKSIRMLESGTGIVSGMTPLMTALIQLPYVLAVIFFIQMIFTYKVLKSKYWGIIRKVYYSVLFTTSILVIIFLIRWNYLPPVW